MIRKSASFNVYDRHQKVSSSSSDTSGSSSSWENSDTPLKRFNRLLRSSMARHWAYFRKDRANLRIRGRSVSDAGLCSIVDTDPELAYLDAAPVVQRRSFQAYSRRPNRVTIPELSITYRQNRVKRKRKCYRKRR
ncbi:hypothetical protein NE865_00663 [Phthorimaea operculella]|nr:hypothetical protein NE865_00663 [Phthorimaea operculella]